MVEKKPKKKYEWSSVCVGGGRPLRSGSRRLSHRYTLGETKATPVARARKRVPICSCSCIETRPLSKGGWAGGRFEWIQSELRAAEVRGLACILVLFFLFPFSSFCSFPRLCRESSDESCGLVPSYRLHASEARVTTASIEAFGRLVVSASVVEVRTVKLSSAHRRWLPCVRCPLTPITAERSTRLT